MVLFKCLARSQRAFPLRRPLLGILRHGARYTGQMVPLPHDSETARQIAELRLAQLATAQRVDELTKNQRALSFWTAITFINLTSLVLIVSAK